MEFYLHGFLPDHTESIEEEIENGNRKCRKISVVVKYRFSYKYVQLLAAVFHGWVEFGGWCFDF